MLTFIIAENTKDSMFIDLFLPIPKQEFHGLFIEMKVGRNRTSVEQDEWIALLRKNGYRAEVCYGADAAIKAIDDYIM